MFTSGELEGFKATQLESLQDTCNLEKYTVTFNSYGEPISSYVVQSGIACGVNMTGGKEFYKGSLIETDTDATIRFPLSTDINIKDRITITKRYGVTVSGLTFEVKQEPRQGISGLVVDVGMVTYDD